MIFTLLGGRLGLLHLRDCGGGGGGGWVGLSLESIICLNFVGGGGAYLEVW